MCFGIAAGDFEVGSRNRFVAVETGKVVVQRLSAIQTANGVGDDPGAVVPGLCTDHHAGIDDPGRVDRPQQALFHFSGVGGLGQLLGQLPVGQLLG